MNRGAGTIVTLPAGSFFILQSHYGTSQTAEPTMNEVADILDRSRLYTPQDGIAQMQRILGID